MARFSANARIPHESRENLASGLRQTSACRRAEGRKGSDATTFHDTEERKVNHHEQPSELEPDQWCTGQHLPETDVVWDMNVCHTWYWVDYGFQANRGHFDIRGN